MTDANDRYRRERDFHDGRYSNETRASAAKYYAVDAGKARYEEWVRRAAGSGTNVLEYGCGKGSLAFELASRGAQVTGVDISPVAIELAEQQAADRKVVVTFTAMNAEALELPDRCVDVVCGSGILHHLDLDLALPEIVRVLRPGGAAIFYEPMGTNPLINLYRRMTPQMRTPDEHPLVGDDFDRMRELFEDVEVAYFNLLSLAGAPLARVGTGPRVIGWLQRLDQGLFRRSPALAQLAWVSVLRMRSPAV